MIHAYTDSCLFQVLQKLVKGIRVKKKHGIPDDKI